MSNPYLAEVRIFTGGFAPKGWASCDGQLMPISQNTALFSLLGTTYGGNGTSNFALPNLQGCAPMQAGQGPGLSLRDLGETAGEQTVTLLQTEMPSHSHTASGAGGEGQGPGPTTTWGGGVKGHETQFYNQYTQQTAVQMNPSAISIAGGNLPHNNMPPFLGLTFIIALQGVYPARN